MKYNLQFFGGRGASSSGTESSSSRRSSSSLTGGRNNDGSVTSTTMDQMNRHMVTTHHFDHSSDIQSKLDNFADNAKFSERTNRFGEKEEYLHATVRGARDVQIRTTVFHRSDGTYDVLSTTTRGSYAGTIKTYKKLSTAQSNARKAFKKNVNAIKNSL